MSFIRDNFVKYLKQISRPSAWCPAAKEGREIGFPRPSDGPPALFAPADAREPDHGQPGEAVDERVGVGRRVERHAFVAGGGNRGGSLDELAADHVGAAPQGTLIKTCFCLCSAAWSLFRPILRPDQSVAFLSEFGPMLL